MPVERDSMGLRPPGVSLGNWFAYSDRERNDPTDGHRITTTGFSFREHGKFDAPGWEKEEWAIASVIVPLDQNQEALERLAQTVFANNYRFEPFWEGPETFEFAETIRDRDLSILPWVRKWEHPVSRDLVVEPREDFLLYHGLEKRRTELGTEYFHPVEGLTVLSCSLEQHGYYLPTPRVTAHRDHLRDFLAARRACLLVSVVADRFANRLREEALELEPVENRQIDENAWLTVTLHAADATRHGYARGRATLHWNLVVEPYESPKVHRSPWPRFFDATYPEGAEGAVPRFVIDEEGRSAPANDPATPQYLYFQPPVLSKYLDTDGYSVFFHMRTWGQACGPRRECVDVGINSERLVTAFAPDIADLNAKDQLHWAAYSTLPSGEVCKELYETRMQLSPPHSPGVTEGIREAILALRGAFEARYSLDPFTDGRPSESDAQKMSVGPLHERLSEVTELAKLLYSWVVQGIEIRTLRAALDEEDAGYEKDDRQLVLLRQLVACVGELEEADAREMLAPLTALNDLRVASAHRLEREVADVFERYGLGSSLYSARAAWYTLVDGVAESLRRASAVVEE